MKGLHTHTHTQTFLHTDTYTHTHTFFQTDTYTHRHAHTLALKHKTHTHTLPIANTFNRNRTFHRACKGFQNMWGAKFFLAPNLSFNFRCNRCGLKRRKGSATKFYSSARFCSHTNTHIQTEIFKTFHANKVNGYKSNIHTEYKLIMNLERIWMCYFYVH